MTTILKATSTTKQPEPEPVPEEVIKWETRPGGMLVQKRDEVTIATDAASDLLLIRVSYAALRFHISIHSRATFGDLKKLLAGESGLEPGDQLLEFRGKERGNGEFLDRCGIKHRSKVILTENPHSKERRLVQMRLHAKIQAAHRAIFDVAVVVDSLADQVCAIEKSIQNGNKVAEVQMTTLVELLMRQAVKLDAITAHGDASAEKILQGV
ncbi:hypothetical protein OSB04_012647 [Centaurea solstitialis]|uniref:Ubiquitin-like domain-containing protein n=1 Tax=Centaurea solstitialis TaxID=347529 RepID=A0AA38TJ97_9ASTR|nr:hypothetical protein OSB04_012647 [Centaurea solstitialis]